jgi:lauroyl/myristoyl acyltransferase
MATFPTPKRMLLRTISAVANTITLPLSLLAWVIVWLYRKMTERGAQRLSALVTTVLFSALFWVRRANLRKFFKPLGWTKGEIALLHRRHKTFLSQWTVDTARLLDMTPEEMEERITFEGEEHLQAALARGKGVLLLNAHIGNWWYGRARLWLGGYRIVAVANRVEILSVEYMLNKLRRRFKSRTLHVARGGSKAAAELFRENGIFSVYFDVAMPPRWKHSFWYPLGRAVIHADVGPARLALKHDAAVLLMTAVRTESGRYRVNISPMPHRADLRPEELHAAWLEELNGIILKYPEQWWNWGAVWLRRGK